MTRLVPLEPPASVRGGLNAGHIAATGAGEPHGRTLDRSVDAGAVALDPTLELDPALAVLVGLLRIAVLVDLRRTPEFSLIRTEPSRTAT